MSAAQLPEGSNLAVNAVSAAVELEPVQAADVVAGTPVQGTLELGHIAGVETGIWELRGGTVTDTEVDELFVVLTGRAVVEFLEPFEGRELATIAVGPGSLVRLAAGMRTRWTVTETLRKVYVV